MFFGEILQDHTITHRSSKSSTGPPLSSPHIVSQRAAAAAAPRNAGAPREAMQSEVTQPDPLGPVRERALRRQRRSSPYNRPSGRTVSLDEVSAERSSSLDGEGAFVAGLPLERSIVSDVAFCPTRGGPGEPARRTSSAGDAASGAPTEKGSHDDKPTALKSLKLVGVPLARSGVSDLMKESTLGASKLSAAIPGQSDFDAFLDDSLERHGVPCASPLATGSGSASGASAGDCGNLFAATSGRPSPPPPLWPSAPEAAALHSPRSITRSKGEALVHAALASLATGSARDSGSCPFMEDESFVHRHLDDSGQLSLTMIGVYDGHGGSQASRYLKSFLHSSVLAHLGTHLAGARGGSYADDVASAALVSGFASCEQSLVASQCTAGSSAVAMMLQSGGRCLNVAWCGDCRAVLSRAGAAVELTTDHRCSNEREAARVVAEGAYIEAGRLGGCLELTRALGGIEPKGAGASPAKGGAKPVGLSALPEVVSEPITSEDEFVLLATDGLWGVLSSAEAVRIARSELHAHEDAQLAAEKLVETALRRKTDDNVTVVLARLFAPRLEDTMGRQMGRQRGRSIGDRSHSFVQLSTPSNFVQVIGGFDQLPQPQLAGSSANKP